MNFPICFSNSNYWIPNLCDNVYGWGGANITKTATSLQVSASRGPISRNYHVVGY